MVKCLPPRVERFVAKAKQGEEAMSEANKKLMARWFEEVWNQGKLGIIDELLAPDAVAWGQAGHGQAMRGAAAFRAYAENLHKAFSGIRMKVEDLIAEGEKVVIRWTVK